MFGVYLVGGNSLGDSIGTDVGAVESCNQGADSDFLAKVVDEGADVGAGGTFY